MDREKVIKGLECCLPAHDPDCDLCPYDSVDLRCRANLRDNVMELLKAQEPRVMTLEEAKSAYVVEYRSGKIREFGSALLDLDVDPLNAEYGKIYRVWTSRPTDAQREAVKWDD